MKTGVWGFVFLACLAVAGCGKKIPGDIIQPARMESLLYDYHLASTMGSSLPYQENYKKKYYYAYVFRKHGVTEAEFDSSMVWYTRHSDELAVIYQNVQKRLEDDEKRMKVQVAKRDNQIDVSMSGDTVDVWQDRTVYWLTSSPLTNKLAFDLKADTSFRPRDAMELSASFHFFPQDVPAGGKAVMAISFYFDNDSVQGLTRTVRAAGRQRLFLRPDSAYSIRSISGFVYYDGAEKPGTSVLLEGISLLRYHDTDKLSAPDSIHARTDASRLSLDSVPLVRPERVRAVQHRERGAGQPLQKIEMKE